ncbi:hypothetical protein KFK09_013079 [Dendrobium nobile]|uniref:FAR1 domain-containing protein n=1 Tax=Dendrobium nobile TaxID=94219 RepID=A0A8T3BJN1_DENNO|nr:hypothetical protein KFK09_013079 [Dendrobium nobile]
MAVLGRRQNGRVEARHAAAPGTRQHRAALGSTARGGSEARGSAGQATARGSAGQAGRSGWVSEEADNLENADVQETSAHEAEHLKPVRLDEKFRISDVYVKEKEAYETYHNYGYNIGFSVRKDHPNYWPNSKSLKSKDFVCSKDGFKKLPDLNIQRKYRRSDTRTGCPSMIRFTVDKVGYWKVKKFIENHNHDLPRPEDRHLLRSCRNMSDEKAFVLNAMTDAGIRTIDAFSFLADEVGGVENIGFTRRDAYNFIQKIKRAKIELGDTNTLIELFKEHQLNDNIFS